MPELSKKSAAESPSVPDTSKETPLKEVEETEEEGLKKQNAALLEMLSLSTSGGGEEKKKVKKAKKVRKVEEDEEDEEDEVDEDMEDEDEDEDEEEQKSSKSKKLPQRNIRQAIEFVSRKDLKSLLEGDPKRFNETLTQRFEDLLDEAVERALQQTRTVVKTTLKQETKAQHLVMSFMQKYPELGAHMNIVEASTKALLNKYKSTGVSKGIGEVMDEVGEKLIVALQLRKNPLKQTATKGVNTPTGTPSSPEKKESFTKSLLKGVNV